MLRPASVRIATSRASAARSRSRPHPSGSAVTGRRGSSSSSWSAFRSRSHCPNCQQRDRGLPHGASFREVVLSRTTGSVGSTWWRGSPRVPPTSSSRSRAAVHPRARMGWRTVVSPGRAAMSSQPVTTRRRPAPRTPRSRSAAYAGRGRPVVGADERVGPVRSSVVTTAAPPLRPQSRSSRGACTGASSPRAGGSVPGSSNARTRRGARRVADEGQGPGAGPRAGAAASARLRSRGSRVDTGRRVADRGPGSAAPRGAAAASRSATSSTSVRPRMTRPLTRAAKSRTAAAASSRPCVEQMRTLRPSRPRPPRTRGRPRRSTARRGRGRRSRWRRAAARPAAPRAGSA